MRHMLLKSQEDVPAYEWSTTYVVTLACCCLATADMEPCSTAFCLAATASGECTAGTDAASGERPAGATGTELLLLAAPASRLRSTVQAERFIQAWRFS
jgi:hypothetical protein